MDILSTAIVVIGVFSVWPLPEVQNLFQKPIWNENVHIYFLIFFGAFQVLGEKKFKNGLPLYFQNVIWVGVGETDFVTIFFFLKKSNTLEYAQVLVVTCWTLNSVAALLSPHPPPSP